MCTHIYLKYTHIPHNDLLINRQANQMIVRRIEDNASHTCTMSRQRRDSFLRIRVPDLNFAILVKRHKSQLAFKLLSEMTWYTCPVPIAVFGNFAYMDSRSEFRDLVVYVYIYISKS